MLKIAILGQPNVGKSSLFNRLIKQNLAITSNISGTTRDVNKSVFTLSDQEVEILDTGGINTIKETNKDDQKEIFSTVREFSLQAGQKADLILYMVDGKSMPQDSDKKLFHTLQKYAKTLLVVNKVDSDKLKINAWEYKSFGVEPLFISVSHNRGISQLLNAMAIDLGIISQYIDASNDLNIEDFLDSNQMTESKIQSKKVSQKSPTQDEQKEQKILDAINQANLDDMTDEIEDIEDEEQDLLDRVIIDENIKVGIIGRVNVGKSSLLNALVGQNRSVVSSIAGTTIDPVDEKIQYKDNTITFIDTAGIRRAGKIEGIEKYALDRTQKALNGANIALLVLDASTPFVELDEKISSLAYKNNLCVIIVLNKWDIRYAEYKEIMTELKYKFRFLEFAPVVNVSATNMRHITELKDMILKVYQGFCLRIPTSLLNRTLKEAFSKHKIPSDHGKFVRIYYGVQYDICPPQIALISNRAKAIHFSYKRYIVNFLRSKFGFIGVPIIITTKNRKGES